MPERDEHRFGGVWTEIKLDAMTEYLNFYQNALKNQGFETWYVDAFAGTGDRHAKIISGGLFENAPIEETEQLLDGSARKALQIEPAFSHYWFAEKMRKRIKVLEALRDEFPHRLHIQKGDANEELQTLFAKPPWQSHRDSWKQRAVVFLDPYGMSVGFDTLEMLAATKRVDVWYLFPRKAVIQQLANDISGVDDAKRASLNRMFGCDDWENRLYAPKAMQTDMFADKPLEGKARVVNGDGIAEFAREQFGKIFAYVSEPLPLLVNGRDFFELYCFSNNPPAISLIKNGVEHVIRKYTPASRRTSGS